MDVREKLVEILRKPIFPHELADPIEAVADYLLDNGVTLKSECEACGKAASDTIVGLQKTIKELSDAQQWIPVTERLPDKVGEYLVLSKNRNQSIQWFYINGDYRDFLYVENGTVTHWMPLPDAPKGE